MIEIRYKCRCMSSEVELMVRERTGSENVVEWMETVVRPALGEDHQKRSPLCVSNAVDYLKIPFDENVPIGNRRKQ